MPVYQAPQSDAQRLDALRAITVTGPKDQAAGKNYLAKTTLEDAVALLTQYEAAFLALDSKLRARAHEVNEKAVALTTLQTTLRDFWEGTRRRNLRKNYPIDVLNFFGLPQDGLRKNFREWVFSLVSVGPVKSGMNPEEFIFDVDQEK